MRKRIMIGLMVSLFFFSFSSGELKIKNPEWKDGEKISYEIRYKGELVGSVDYLIVDTLVGGTKAYMIKVATLTGYLGVNTYDSISLIVNQNNLKPINLKRYFITPEDIKMVHARYLEDKVKFKIDTFLGTEEKEIDFPEDGYDNEEVVLLLRALPLKEGTRVTFSNISSLAAKSIPVEIEISKSEKIKAPLGEFLCNRLKMKSGEKYVDLWYQKSKPYLMVRYLDNTSGTEILLKEHK